MTDSLYKKNSIIHTFHMHRHQTHHYLHQGIIHGNDMIAKFVQIKQLKMKAALIKLE